MSEQVEFSGGQLERFRDYLSLLARAQLGPHNRAWLDASDIVQDTLLEAHCHLDQFRGQTVEQMAAWLRRMLSFNLVDAFRALNAQKRNPDRELFLDQTLDETCSRLEAWAEAVQTSPSQRASRNEQLARLAWALAQLLPAEREAIELHQIHGLTLKETAEQLGRTSSAVSGLQRRGFAKLRQLLDDPESRSSAT